MSMKLAVVQKLRLINAAKAGDAELTLRKVRQQGVSFGEQHHRRPQQFTLTTQQTQTAQDSQRVTGIGVGQAPTPNSLLHGSY